MWTCGKNSGWIQLGFFHKSTFPFFYQLHFLRITFKSDGAFFLDSGWEALAKKSFSVTGKFRGKRWIKALEAEFFFKNEA